MARVWIAVVVALLPAFQYGVALTVTSTMFEAFPADLGFDQNVGGAVASAALYFGAVIGGLGAARLERHAGKRAQLCIGFLFLTGNLLCSFTTKGKVCWDGPADGCVATMLLIGRVITGIASGFTIVVSPKYLAAVSPPSIRGALGASVQLLVAFGVFAGVFMGLPYEFDDRYEPRQPWWRYMFIIAAVPAIIQCGLAILTFPLANQSTAQLQASLSAFMSSWKLSNIVEQNDEQKDVESATETAQGEEAAATKDASAEHPQKFQFSDLLRRRYRRSVLLGIGVPIASQISGISVVGTYSTIIFEDAGFDHAVTGSILFGLGNVFASFIAVFLFDKYGRTTVASVSFSGMALSHLALALSDLASNSISGPLSVVFLFVYILAFGVGSGGLNVMYPPEVVPPEIAGVVLGLGQSLSVSVSLLSVLVFPAVLDAAGVLWSFLILFGFTLASLIFLRLFMIETKGRILADVMTELCGLPNSTPNESPD